MPASYDAAWDRAGGGTDTVAYGPDIPGETELRLLGDLKGKRVLDLGCGSGAGAIAVAKQRSNGACDVFGHCKAPQRRDRRDVLLHLLV